MTTSYSTKEQALSMGIIYAGSKQSVEELNVICSNKMKQFPFTGEEAESNAFPIEIYEVINENGKTGHLGIEQFRGNQYALWLIDPESGMSVRT